MALCLLLPPVLGYLVTLLPACLWLLHPFSYVNTIIESEARLRSTQSQPRLLGLGVVTPGLAESTLRLYLMSLHGPNFVLCAFVRALFGLVMQ